MTDLDKDVSVLEADLGERVKDFRLSQNLSQDDLASMVNLSRGAIRNLELGNGSTVSTLIAVMKGLGSTDWIKTLAPVPTIDPRRYVPGEKTGRKRAYRARA